MKWSDNRIIAAVAFAFGLGVFAGQLIANAKWRPILIEHGAAYYTHDTGEFTIIRKDGEQGNE